MGKILYVTELEDRLKRLKKHDVGSIRDVLPFTSHTSKAIKGDFNNGLGESVRTICGLLSPKKQKTDELVMNDNPFIEEIINKIECDNDDERYDLSLFLEAFLLSDQEKLNPVHPYLFNYLPVDEKKKNEHVKYSRFIRDTLVLEDEEIKEIFKNQETEDILSELILTNMNRLNEKKSERLYYEPLLKPLSTLFREDLKFISKYKDYFLNSFPLLTHFYTFMYACQLLVQFEKFEKGNYEEIHPFYFALEWESVSKRRKVAEDLEGFKYIKEKASRLFVHIHALSQLSYNRLNIIDFEEEPVRFMTYSSLMEKVGLEGESALINFLDDIGEWISKYCEWANIDQPEESENLSQAYRSLFECLKKKMNEETCKNFGQNIEFLGANQFLKNRGSLGKVFNISHEFLRLLSAVCIKNERMPLNQLFEEYAKRGVTFDRYSKKEIVELLDSLNIIDKKSDSGDAQYVKPIL